MKRFWSADASPDTQAVMTLLLCFSLNMLGRGMSDSFAVFVLPLGREFGWARAELMGAYSISLLVFASSAPFAGALLDRYSHRRLYLTGLVCLAASLLGASVADRLWEIYVCVGVLGGVALATLGMIPAATLLRRWFTRSLSTAMGIAYTGLGCGALLFVPAAQHLIDIVGWRLAYRSLGLFVAALALLAGLLPWRRIAHGRHAAAPAAHAAPREPVLPDLRRALHRRMFWALASVFFFTSAGMFMLIIQIVAYLVAVGVPPFRAAGIFGIIGGLSIVGMIGSGWLAGRIGFRAVGVGSYAISLAGIALLDMMSHVPHPALLAGFVIAFGIAQGTRGPLIATLCARLFAGPAAGSVFGIITAAGGFGGALGSLLAGVLFDVSGGYELSFAVAAASLMLASVPFLVLPEFRTR